MSQTVKKEIRTDVLVTGSGLEGCIAAAELAKAGQRVLLIEQQGSLGEASTNGLETYLPLSELSLGKAYAYGERILKEAGEAQQINGPFYDDQKLKTVLASLLKEAGVTVLTHIFVSEVIPGTEGKESLCRIECKTGPIDVYAKAIIDAGDYAATAAAAGFVSEEAADEEMPESLSRETQAEENREKEKTEKEKTEKEKTTAERVRKIRSSMKCSGISEQELQKHAKPGYRKEGDYLIGELDFPFAERKKCSGGKGEILYTSQSVHFCRNSRFGETIFTGIEAQTTALDPFVLSQIQAGMREFSYDLRKELREKEIFPQMTIIFVSPILNRYGVRKAQIPETVGLFRQDTEEYSNAWAIETGIGLAERVKAYLGTQP